MNALTGIRHRPLELALDLRRLIEHVDRPLGACACRRHLARRILQIHDPRADLRDHRLRHDERLPETRVEPLCDIAHQLDMLALVLADRNLVRTVGEDVGGHQHRIEEQAGRAELALLRRLVLVLRHPLEVPLRRHRREQPGELGVLAYIGLAEEDAALGVEARCEQDRRRVIDELGQLARVERNRQRVQVDDAVDRLAAVLQRDPLDDRADVVAEVLTPSRLDAGEGPHARQATGDLRRASERLAQDRLLCRVRLVEAPHRRRVGRAARDLGVPDRSARSRQKSTAGVPIASESWHPMRGCCAASTRRIRHAGVEQIFGRSSSANRQPASSQPCDASSWSGQVVPFLKARHATPNSFHYKSRDCDRQYAGWQIVIFEPVQSPWISTGTRIETLELVDDPRGVRDHDADERAGTI